MELPKPTSTFSSTDICVKRRMFWNVRAMPMRLTSVTDLPAVAVPSSRMEPRVGL